MIPHLPGLKFSDRIPLYDSAQLHDNSGGISHGFRIFPQAENKVAEPISLVRADGAFCWIRPQLRDTLVARHFGPWPT